MRFYNSHPPAEVGHQDALALVHGPACMKGHPLLIGPADSPACIVSGINLAADVTQIAQAVVRAVTVDMVNVIRLFAVNKKPCKPVDVVSPVFNRDLIVTGFGFGGLATRYLSRVGVVLNDIAHGIRNNLRSHVVPPYDVVRGLGIAVPSTPILSQEFASSGGNSRGTNWISPCSTITDTPFKERR